MQAEDKAWQEYKLSRFEGHELSHDENLMYHQCFIAGYRAAQHSVQADGADSVCPECGAKLNYCTECEKRVTPRR